MSVHRVVPNIPVGAGDAGPDASALRENAAFYGLLGFEEVMNHGWIMTLASPTQPAAQVSFMTRDATGPVDPDLSVEVADVDAVHAALVRQGRTSCTARTTRSGACAASSYATRTAKWSTY